VCQLCVCVYVCVRERVGVLGVRVCGSHVAGKMAFYIVKYICMYMDMRECVCVCAL